MQQKSQRVTHQHHTTRRSGVPETAEESTWGDEEHAWGSLQPAVGLEASRMLEEARQAASRQDEQRRAAEVERVRQGQEYRQEQRDERALEGLERERQSEVERAAAAEAKAKAVEAERVVVAEERAAAAADRAEVGPWKIEEAGEGYTAAVAGAARMARGNGSEAPLPRRCRLQPCSEVALRLMHPQPQPQPQPRP